MSKEAKKTKKETAKLLFEKKGKWTYKLAKQLRGLDWEIGRIYRAAKVVEHIESRYEGLNSSDLEALFEFLWDSQQNEEESDPLDEQAYQWVEEKTNAKKAEEDK